MNRLTNKDINWYEDFVFSMRNRLITENEIKDSIYNRLKLLEDLEEDIGMSLLTLFKILKRGQIICKFRPIEEPKKILLLSRKIKSLYYDGCYYRLEINEDGDDGYIIEYDPYIKDYGVTWDITKKELEMNNDIEKELKELQIQYDKVLKERNELKKENKLLKKDLEILEIIKKWSFIQEKLQR